MVLSQKILGWKPGNVTVSLRDVITLGIFYFYFIFFYQRLIWAPKMKRPYNCSPFSSPLLFSCIPGGRCLTQRPPQVGRPMMTLTLLQYSFGDSGGTPPSLSSGAAQRFLRLQKLKIKVEEEHKQRSLIGPLNRRSPASLSWESKWRSRQGAHNTTLPSQLRNISGPLQQEAGRF